MSLELAAGGVTGIIGPNGANKATLVHVRRRSSISEHCFHGIHTSPI